MAEKISIQIALEGGQAVARQLADIGDAGQQAFDQIAQSAEQVGGFKNLKPEEVTAKLKELGVEGTAAFGKIQKAVSTAVRFETLVSGIQSVENAFIALGRAAGPIGLAMAAAFQSAAKATIAFAGTINKASDQAVKLGMSLQQFKNFQQMFLQLGVSGDAAAEGFAKFRQELEKAAAADPAGQLAAFGLSTAAAQQQLQQFLQQLRQMPDGLERTNLAISQLGQTAGTQFIQGLRAAEGSMSESERKAYALGQAIERLQTAWTNFGSVQLAPVLTAGIDALTAALDRCAQSWMGMVQAASLLNPINAVVQGLIALVEKLGQTIAAARGGPGAPLPEPGGVPMAGGGLMGGRGTGTSDSNLAWLSRGEHVMPARAVQQPGVLAFLEALRRSGGNLRGVLDSMSRFALGGLVPRAIPAYAAGGPVGRMNHVTIQFPGLPAINGLRASSDVIGELQRTAALAQVRSGGRKPSRYS